MFLLKRSFKYSLYHSCLKWVHLKSWTICKALIVGKMLALTERQKEREECFIKWCQCGCTRCQLYFWVHSVQPEMLCIHKNAVKCLTKPTFEHCWTEQQIFLLILSCYWPPTLHGIQPVLLSSAYWSSKLNTYAKKP